jgi:hypothetical protein
MALPIKPTPVSMFMVVFCGIVLFFLDTFLRITSAIELLIMQTPILKQIYYFLMI